MEWCVGFNFYFEDFKYVRTKQRERNRWLFDGLSGGGGGVVDLYLTGS